MKPNEADHPTPSHILKPHHLQLVRILDLTFRKYADKKLPPTFLLYMYRILMVELSEVRQPASYEQMLQVMESNPDKNELVIRDLVQEYKNTHRFILSPDHLGLFFKDSVSLVSGRDEDEDLAPFNRRSLFGFFVRRCFISFLKLSFEAQSQLYADYHTWVGGHFAPNSVRIRLDVLDNSYYLFRIHSDKRQLAEVDPYEWFVKDEATGDTMNAEERLRCFFEQYFHERSDSGMRQLALLHLARMHYIHHEYPACQKLLHEAINVARSHNDKLTLQHCLGLLHRIPEKGQRSVLNEIQPDLHPFEILYDVKKLMQVNNQPLSATFDKLTQVTALYDNWSDFQHQRVSETEQWAQHTVQGIAWDMLGCPMLSAVHDKIVMTFTDPGNDDNTRLTATMNYARTFAQAGSYKYALCVLLQPETWVGLTLSDYNAWAGQVWSILALRASRRGQSRLYNEFLKPKRPNVPHYPRELWFGSDPSGSVGSIIRDPLYDVLSMQQKDQANRYIEPLLTALWHAEYQQRWGLYRTALTVLADIGLDYGMTKWCCKLLEEIMPQIMFAQPEQKGFALATYARCVIATGGAAPDALRKSIRYLMDAEEALQNIELLKPLQDTQYLLSVVYHNLGMEVERDRAAERCHATQEERGKLAQDTAEDWVVKLWDLVSRVGATIAAKT